jgi:hypothetical protein
MVQGRPTLFVDIPEGIGCNAWQAFVLFMGLAM